MSVTTEIKVIHRQLKPATISSSRLFLPNDGDEDDIGLVMKMDSKLKETTTMRAQSSGASPTSIVGLQNASAVRPSAVSSQLCGQGHEVTGWLLSGVLFLQTAHIPFIKLTQKMSDTVQRKAKLLMPVVFYMSLLVLLVQVGAVLMLFFQSFMPIGMWFLLCCIGILAGMFCYTAILANPHSRIQKHLKVSTSGYKLL